MLEVAHSNRDGWQVREVWQQRAEMKCKFTSPVRWGDHVYGLDDGILACIDLTTGKRAWKQGRYKHGQVLLCGDLLIVQAEDPGDVVLVRMSPKEPVELARLAALGSKTWNNPALSGNHLLVRNDREAVCYELPGE
jgi:outer membrane protein assembly factor BamB